MAALFEGVWHMVVLIPAYQPDEKLYRLVTDLRDACDYAILIVNDGSSAACAPLFERLQALATVIGYQENRGKGAAIKYALTYVGEHYPAYDGVVIADADGQHLPKDIIRVAEAWAQSPDKLVLGSRRFTGKVPFKSRAGNAITRGVFAISTGVKLHDTQTGLRAFSASRIPEMLAMKGERYDYEINVLLYATRHGIPIEELPIETVYIENNASSHFKPLRDAWRIYRMIFLFVGSSFLAMAVDYVLVILLTALLAKLPDATALLCSTITARLVSSFINYFINRRVVFETRGRSVILRYYLLAAGIWAANYGLLNLTTLILPVSIGKLLVELLLYPVSFLLQRAFVFPVSKEENR